MERLKPRKYQEGPVDGPAIPLPQGTAQTSPNFLAFKDPEQRKKWNPTEVRALARSAVAACVAQPLGWHRVLKIGTSPSLGPASDSEFFLVFLQPKSMPCCFDGVTSSGRLF